MVFERVSFATRVFPSTAKSWSGLRPLWSEKGNVPQHCSRTHHAYVLRWNAQVSSITVDSSPSRITTGILGACRGSRPGVAVASSSLKTVPYKARCVRRSSTAADFSRKVKALCVILRAPRQHGSECRACKYSVSWLTSRGNTVPCASASQERSGLLCGLVHC